MKKSYFAAVVVIVVALVVFLVLSGALYTIDQTEQVIITQFGQPVGDPITEPGLHFKIPFVQNVNSLDKRFPRMGRRSGCHPYEGQDIHPSRRIRALAH